MSADEEGLWRNVSPFPPDMSLSETDMKAAILDRVLRCLVCRTEMSLDDSSALGVVVTRGRASLPGRVHEDCLEKAFEMARSEGVTLAMGWDELP